MGDEGFWIFISVLITLGIIGCPIASVIILVGVRKRQRLLANEVAGLRKDVRKVRAVGASPRTEPTPQSAPAQAQATPTPTPAPVAAPTAPVAAPAPVPPPIRATTPPMAAATSTAPTQPSQPQHALPGQNRAATPAPATTSHTLEEWQPLPPREPREPSPFEAAAQLVLQKTWSWITVGEEYRKPGQTAEMAVATNWLVRVAAVIIILGVGFLFHYSSTKGWLNPQAKVTMAMLFGAATLAGGIRLLGKKYDLIAQGLMGIGLASLYAAIFAAANMYDLIGTLPAFGLMILVTIGAGVMSVRFNSLLIAILGIIGGYGTPVMLSSGSGNLVGLYAYMSLLGIGVLGISERRGWHLLNAMAFAATWGLVFTSLEQYYELSDFWKVMPFLAGFFALFSTTAFIHQLVHAKKASVLELIMLMLNAGIFFTIGYGLIQDAYSTEWTAVLAVAMAAFYIAHLYLFISKKRNDRGLALGFIALAAFFLIITVPLLLSDQWLTLCWSAQALVLLWLAAKVNSRFLRYVAYLLYLIVIGRFFTVDLYGQFGDRVADSTTLLDYMKLLGQRVLSFGFPVASMAAAMRLHQRPASASANALEAENDIKEIVPPGPTLITIIAIVATMLFIYLHLEFNRTMLFLFSPVRLPVLTMLWIGACAILLACFRRTSAQPLFILLMLFVVGTLVKLAVVDFPFWNLDLPTYRFDATTYSFLEAGMRLLDFGVILAFFIYAFNLVRAQKLTPSPHLFFGYGALALFLIYWTFELNTLLAHFVPGLRAGGISMLWGTCALALVTGGIIKNVRPVRFTGLAIFLIATIKVIAFDLRSLDPLYRIIAFIVLGIALLGGAFVYIRFENILNGNSTPNNTDGTPDV